MKHYALSPLAIAMLLATAGVAQAATVVPAEQALKNKSTQALGIANVASSQETMNLVPTTAVRRVDEIGRAHV